jgi:hypothetical protein
VKLKIARRSVGQGEVITLPIAGGAEGADRVEAAADDASRYSARYSSSKDKGFRAKIAGRAAAMRAGHSWRLHTGDWHVLGGARRALA